MEPQIRNEFEQSLLDNGYKIFTYNNRGAIRGFQKRITDETGVKYFITVDHYNHAEQLDREDIPKGDSYTSESQFTFQEATSDLLYWGKDVNIENIENFFESFWKSMNPDYYEKY